VLELKSINTYYDLAHIVHDLSLAVGDKEIVGVLGRNGVGKTTTVRSIMGLTPPKDGQIIFNGIDITKMPPHLRARLGIGLVPQGRHLFHDMNVLENLETGILKGPLPKETLGWIMDFLPSLKGHEKQEARTLSGGEQQMLAIGRALVPKPKIILFDEPFEGLMPILVQNLLDVIKGIRDMGVGVLIVEQRVKNILKVSDRVLLMEHGAIQYEGTPDEIAKNEEVLLKYVGVTL
jgi:branched-chain amino acid transport system ATP-binding protein